MAQRGIDGVSLSEINKAAGQRNTSSLHYHFGNKAGLIQAIFDKHTPGIEVRRQEILDDLTETGVTLRGAIEALVLPIAEKLDEKGGGASYLQFAAQLQSNPEMFKGKLDRRTNRAAQLLAEILRQEVPDLPRAVIASRLRLAMMLLFHALADISEGQKLRAPEKKRDQAFFVTSLIDALVAILSAPVSSEAARALRRRPNPKPKRAPRS